MFAGTKKTISLITLALTWSTTSGLPAFSQTSTKAIELNNEGVRALGAQNFKLAVQKLEASLQHDPSYDRARANLAIAYNNYGLTLRDKPQEAIRYFHKAYALDQTNATTRANIDGVIALLGKSPRNFQDRVELGDAARKCGDFTGAIVEYQAAVSIKDDPAVREKLGDVYRVQDKVDKAIAEYKSGIRIKDSAQLEVKLGQALCAKGDDAGAIAALQMALKLDSKDPDVLDCNVTVWDNAFSRNPTAPENHLGLGKALMYRGDFDQAKEHFLQAMRFSPGKVNSEAQQLLTQLPALKKQAQFERHLNNGKDLQARGLFDAALEEYKVPLASEPNNVELWVRIGSAYQGKRDYSSASEAFAKALKIDSNSTEAKKGLHLAETALAEQKARDAAKTAEQQAKIASSKVKVPESTPTAIIQGQKQEPLVTRVINQVNQPNAAQTVQKLGRCQAILVATDTYSHKGFTPLANPTKDARDLKEILTKYYGWDVIQLENRSKLDIMDAIINAVNQKPEYDELFIYIAGHGDWDNNLHDGMIVTTDSRDQDRTRDSYITYSELKTLLERGGCKKVLLALDVCFGGTFLDQIGKTRSSATDIYSRSTLDDCLTRIKDRYTRKLVTPGEKEVVYEGLPGQHSPLARNLLRTLVQKGGDRGFVRFIDIETAATDTKPMGRAAGFSDSDDPTSDFVFVPLEK